MKAKPKKTTRQATTKEILNVAELAARYLSLSDKRMTNGVGFLMENADAIAAVTDLLFALKAAASYLPSRGPNCEIGLVKIMVDQAIEKAGG